MKAQELLKIFFRPKFRLFRRPTQKHEKLARGLYDPNIVTPFSAAI
jgi:hypothetical protein